MIEITFDILLANGDFDVVTLPIAHDPDEPDVALHTRAWQAIAAIAGGYAITIEMRTRA